ncbi:MAG: hypothetical protein H7222_14890 [Methylotenera sp.]|nr:hypothetical protein [Oligoflexia bacterium]
MKLSVSTAPIASSLSIALLLTSCWTSALAAGPDLTAIQRAIQTRADAYLVRGAGVGKVDSTGSSEFYFGDAQRKS